MKTGMREWFASGSPWVWLNAAAVTTSIIMVAGLLLLIAVRGMGHFWPKDVVEFTLQAGDGQRQLILGEIHDSEEVAVERLRAAGYELDDDREWVTRYLVKTGNRDLTGMDFRWLLDSQIFARRQPADVVTMERREWGNFYGYLKALQRDGKTLAEGAAAWPVLQAHLRQSLELFTRIRGVEKRDIGAINAEVERLRLRQRRLELDGELTPQRQQALAAQRAALDRRYAVLQDQLQALYRELNRYAVVMVSVDGRQATIPVAKVVRVYHANDMSAFQKIGLYFSKLWEFVSDEPREANTEGGIFPAIFGTVMMVILMSIFVTPFGVIAAIYLREYARQGPLTRVIRIAVNNLASVPSIVYGVFGLGFFVYFLGGNIDQLFFPEALPAPTLGTPGILWASHPGPAHRSGGDRGHRGGAVAHPPRHPRGQHGLGRHQGGDPVAHGAAHGQPGHHDRPDPGHRARRRRGGAADAGGGGETGAQSAPGWQFSLSAPGSEIHALGLSYL